ncbi:polyhydroxyalkanoate synthesis repressor PhaR [Alkalicaulis satelles]|uniref:Polyhydroxyalkanoate synthesis repressor PhaR n=1 Tax=Alkalicaulis satelles TaxID=2609175 RepID=A0A5M6ZKS7_9PROT|nr:polyhydroxyalkanoate synthesis repressor PhaR [Alkalicaulis satelles]KAA5805452.1 polyhydroxyalkanoate synthesis repressor PhaR [Alkalicaulis satelles]
MTQSDHTDIVTIKKYANRRLYDTSASRYVTLDHLRDLVKQGREFKVVDAKSGEDLTRGVLAQIIFEEESKGETLLPVEFLRQLISFYGDSMQTMVPGYLRLSMDNFARQQSEMRDKMASAIGSPAASMALIEEQTRRNMAMFEQAMKMFTPGMTGAAPERDDAPSGLSRADVEALRAELDAMRKRLDRLSGEG